MENLGVKDFRNKVYNGGIVDLSRTTWTFCKSILGFITGASQPGSQQDSFQAASAVESTTYRRIGFDCECLLNAKCELFGFVINGNASIN